MFNESGMYVGFDGRHTPWHGQGVKVKEAPTSADALRLAGLDWKVKQEEVFTARGMRIKGALANVRDKDGECLGIVSGSYSVVQNEDAFAFMDALLGEGVTYETAGSLNKGKRVWMLARLPEDFKLLGNEPVDPYFVITNSHDGTSAVRVAMTPIRVWCQNTLNLALERAKRSWSTAHKGDVLSKTQDAAKTLTFGKKYVEQLERKAEELAAIKLSATQIETFTTLLFPIDEKDTERKKTTAKLKQNDLLDRYYNAPDLQGLGNNAYRYINAVTDFATHTSVHKNTQRYEENLLARTIDGNLLIDTAMKMVTEA